MKCVDRTEDPMLYNALDIPSNKALNETIRMKKRNTEVLSNTSKRSDDYQSKAKDPSKCNTICLLLSHSLLLLMMQRLENHVRQMMIVRMLTIHFVMVRAGAKKDSVPTLPKTNVL